MQSACRLGSACLFLSLFLSKPCLADDAASAGSSGEADAANRSASVPPPQIDKATLDELARAKPKLPKVTPPADSSAQRGMIAPRAEDFGTVTKEIGGGESEEPASPEVERRLLKGSELAPPASNDATALAGDEDTGGMPPTVQRKVFGADDRVWIAYNYNADYAFRAVGLLWIKFQDGSSTTCSATLIQPSYVLTAAHCVVDEATRQIASYVEFYPGYNGGSAPYGAYAASRLQVLSGYINAPSTVYGWDHLVYDLALVRLREEAGNRVGWLGFGFKDDLPPFTANMIGYPVDKPNLTMWRASCDVDPLIAYDPRTFEHKCDTYGGSSGASVYDYDQSSKTRTIFAVNVAESESANTAVGLTGAYYCWLRQNMGKSC
jgi:V8-like Glu-specific endopeptidase